MGHLTNGFSYMNCSIYSAFTTLQIFCSLFLCDPYLMCDLTNAVLLNAAISLFVLLRLLLSIIYNLHCLALPLILKSLIWLVLGHPSISRVPVPCFCLSISSSVVK